MAARGKAPSRLQGVADALAGAEAGAWLLQDLQTGHLSAVLQNDHERREWLASMATESIVGALTRARARLTAAERTTGAK